MNSCAPRHIFRMIVFSFNTLIFYFYILYFFRFYRHFLYFLIYLYQLQILHKKRRLSNYGKYTASNRNAKKLIL